MTRFLVQPATDEIKTSLKRVSQKIEKETCDSTTKFNYFTTE